ncbi:MAG: hypothetical protein AB2A00_43455 [Myxococcota bacterium]
MKIVRHAGTDEVESLYRQARTLPREEQERLIRLLREATDDKPRTVAPGEWACPDAQEI